MLHTCTRSERASSLHLTDNLGVEGPHLQCKKAASSKPKILASVSIPSIWTKKKKRRQLQHLFPKKEKLHQYTISYSPYTLWKELSYRHFCFGNYQRMPEISFRLMRHPPRSTPHTAAPSTYTDTLARRNWFYGLLRHIRK